MATTTAWIPATNTPSANLVAGVATVDINETETLSIPCHGAAVVHINVPTIDAANLTFNVVPYPGATARLLKDSAGATVTYTGSTGARSFTIPELAGVHTFTILLTAAQTSAARELQVACVGQAPIAHLTVDSPSLEDRTTTAVATGTTGIDDSVQTETTAWPILTIAPATGAPLSHVKVVLDLNKATDGYGAVETTATIQFAIARMVDGTNWRIGTFNTAVSGTNAAANTGYSLQELDIGPVGVTEQVRVYAKMSADATLDMVLPYNVYYMGITAPTITPVVNG